MTIRSIQGRVSAWLGAGVSEATCLNRRPAGLFRCDRTPNHEQPHGGTDPASGERIEWRDTDEELTEMNG